MFWNKGCCLSSVFVGFLLVVTSFFSVVSVADSSDMELNYSFLFSEPDLGQAVFFDESFTSLSIPGCMAIGRGVGQPCIPVRFVQLLIPFGMEVVDIGVSGTGVLLDVESMGVDLVSHLVVPYQKPLPFGEPLPDDIDFDSLVYGSDVLFPSDMIRNQGVGYSRGYQILSFGLSPVQYNPVDGELWYYEELNVRIDLEETGYVNEFYRGLDSDRDWVESLVFNPVVSETYDVAGFGPVPLAYPGGLCDPSDDFDYVIITTETNGLDYWDTDGGTPYNWESLMDKHETEDGLSCTLVTMEDIDAESDYYDPDPLFDDTAAHIREFCRDAYEDWGTSYVLVGGDDNWIPRREMDYEYESNCETDLYWSNLDGTFNDDGDYDWGERGDSGFDLYSELFIGSLSCDEPQDVSNWMTKSFYYADSVDKDYLDNAAFYGGNLGYNFNVRGETFIEYGAIQGTTDWLGPDPNEHGEYPDWLGFQYGFETWNTLNPGQEYNISIRWTGETLPSPWDGWQGGSESSATSGFKDAINSDNVTLISGIAHSDSYMSLDVYDSTWESDYHNTKPFFITEMGCHSGNMDGEDDGVLHSMLFHSDTELAFGTIMNTGYGWGSSDSTNSSSAIQMKCFWDYLFDVTNGIICLM